MRHKGRITGWKDDRGFGFIIPTRGGSQPFVHISAFANRNRRPSENDLVTYTLAADAKGRARAVQVEFVADPATRAPANSAVVRATAVALAFFALVGTAILLEVLPTQVFIVHACASAAAFVMYWHDKSAARASAWRTPETTLHAIGLFGGWPGSLIAMRVFRHKSSKASFRFVFWATVAMNCIGLVWLASEPGSKVLQKMLGAE